MNRRKFIKTTALGSAALMAGCSQDTGTSGPSGGEQPDTTPTTFVGLVRTSNRSVGVIRLMEMMNFESPADKHVLLKPNFNTSDPPPASTHNDTLSQIILELQNRSATDITLIERCFQPFEEVIRQKNIEALAETHNFSIVDLNNEQTSLFIQDGHHWTNGFQFPDIVRDAEYIICTCCLKTHFIARHTLALKLAVGMLPTSEMAELHSAPTTDLMKMVAEINSAFTPKLYIMDGVRTFIDGGPSTGTPAEGNVMLAGTDPVALDAVGIAILRDLGSQNFNGPIYLQPQISRGMQLGLGVQNLAEVGFITDDDESREYADRLQRILESDAVYQA
ncbi:DUF362 domain-containing protein [Bacteroidota bacterium]